MTPNSQPTSRNERREPQGKWCMKCFFTTQKVFCDQRILQELDQCSSVHSRSRLPPNQQRHSQFNLQQNSCKRKKKLVSACWDGQQRQWSGAPFLSSNWSVSVLWILGHLEHWGQTQVVERQVECSNRWKDKQKFQIICGWNCSKSKWHSSCQWFAATWKPVQKSPDKPACQQKAHHKRLMMTTMLCSDG